MLRGAHGSRARTGAVVALLVLVAGCGAPTAVPGGPAPAAAVAPATLGPGELPSAAEGSTVLRMSGRIGATNGRGALRLDLPTLQRLGLWKVAVYEPFLERVVEFQGVWLADLLAAAETDADATDVHLTALDDYEADLTMDDVRSGAVLLATGTGTGAPLPVAEGGPVRIVLTGDIPSGATQEKWIWSVATIEVG